MNADDKTEILSLDRSIAKFLIKETVCGCHSPVVTDLENPLVQFYSKNEPKMMKADLENAVIMHEKTLGPLSVISGGNLADGLT